MRQSALHFLAFALGAAAQHQKSPRAPGVAFRLAPDYGIAAIYLKDGTAVSVAQVYGSPAYQAFMRRDDGPVPTEPSKFCRLLTPALDRLPAAITSSIDVCRNADVFNTKVMLGILKSATESYLGTNICYAAIDLDDVSKYKADTAQEALSALGLHQVLSTIQTSLSFVLAHMPGATPAFDEEPWPVLTIDYSSHWFTVGLYTIGEAGIVDPVEGYVGGPRIDEDNQLGALRETLRHLLSHPPAHIRLPDDLRHLVVYGDDENNQDIRHILAEALINEQLPIHNTRDLLRDANMSSSVFDGPATTAYYAHVHMDWIDFERVPSSFGCKWRSKLYSENQTEL